MTIGRTPLPDVPCITPDRVVPTVRHTGEVSTTDSRLRPRWSVRTRVLTAVVLLSFTALIFSGGATFWIERNRIESTERDALYRTAAQVHQIAEDRYSQRTGLPFENLSDILYIALQVVPADPAQGMMGFVEGTARYNARPDVQVRFEDDPELVEQLVRLSTSANPVDQQITTSTSSYRVYVLPMQFISDAGTESGAFVVGYDRPAAIAPVNENIQTFALIATLALLLIVVVAWVVTGRLLEPLRQLRLASGDIQGSSDLTRRIPVTGHDDLALLTEMFNSMLDRLQRSFNDQRNLIDDVGHELRTPLTVVRGHLELMETGDPSDVAQTREIVIDEIDRMNVLVDDLVTLSKANRPDFVKAAPTDVALLVDDVLTKARALGDRQWRLDALAEVTWDLDPGRITQALLQLAANSVKFSEAASLIAIGSSVSGTGLRLWVRDEGVGIAREDQARIFDRFQRVDIAKEGSGLGLTIVSSIVASHGGSVEIQSSTEPPHRGTTITLVLPAESTGKDIESEDSDR